MAERAIARLNSNPTNLGIVKMHIETIAIIKNPIIGFLSGPVLDFRSDIPNLIKPVYLRTICGNRLEKDGWQLG
jgi:hypothetical protein